jgi:hypothetical protein
MFRPFRQLLLLAVWIGELGAQGKIKSTVEQTAVPRNKTFRRNVMLKNLNDEAQAKLAIFYQQQQNILPNISIMLFQKRKEQ